MAKSWNNTVPSGQTGTGAAVVYGRNTAAQNFGQQLTNLRQREDQQEALRQRRAQELAKSYRDNALSASSGSLWSSELGKLEQEHINEGAQLFQRQINPYTSFDPESLDYMNKRRNIEGLREYRKGVEGQYLKTIENIRKSKPGEYRQEDIKALNDWIANTNLSDAYSSNMQIPEVRKQFNPADAIKGVRAVTSQEVITENGKKRDVMVLDREATQDAILGTLVSNPAGQEYLQEITNGIPIQDIQDMSSDIDGNRQAVIHEYDSNEPFRNQIANDLQIIDKEDPRFQQLVDSIAQERTLAKRRFDGAMNNLVAMSSSGLKLHDKETSDYSEARERRAEEQLNISKQRLSITKAQQAGKSPNNIISEEGREINLPVGEGTENATTVKFRDFIGVPVPNRSMVGIRAFNTTTGQMETLRDVADDYSTSGVGVIDNPPEGISSAAALVKAKDEVTGLTTSYIIDAEMLPKNLKKADLELIDGIKRKAQSGPATVKFKGLPPSGKF